MKNTIILYFKNNPSVSNSSAHPVTSRDNKLVADDQAMSRLFSGVICLQWSSQGCTNCWILERITPRSATYRKAEMERQEITSNGFYFNIPFKSSMETLIIKASALPPKFPAPGAESLKIPASPISSLIFKFSSSQHHNKAHF